MTTLAPAGDAHTYDTVIPTTKHTTEITPELIITLLNVRHTRIDVSAGKMIRLEIRSAPIIRIPNTIVTAVKTAINVLYKRFIKCDGEYLVVKKDIKGQNHDSQDHT